MTFNGRLSLGRAGIGPSSEATAQASRVINCFSQIKTSSAKITIIKQTVHCSHDRSNMTSQTTRDSRPDRLLAITVIFL